MTFLLPVLLAGSLLWIPGLVLLLAAGVRSPLCWGAAPALTVTAGAVLATVLHLLGVRWSALSTALALALLALALWGARRLLVRRRGAVAGAAPEGPTPSRRLAGLSALTVSGSVLLGLGVVASASRRMGGLDTLNGSYDAFYHLSAVAFLREGGDAFAWAALQGIYGEPTYYPVAFDALAALLPWDPVVSTNALMLACLASLPGAVAAMVAALVPDPVRARLLALCAAGAATLFLSTAAMGLVMGLWPIVLGTVCLPPAVAAVLRVRSRREGGSRVDVLAAVLLMGAAGLAHPSVLFSAAVVAGCVLIGHGIVALQRGRRRHAAKLLGVAAAGAAVYLLGSALTLGDMDLTRRSGLGAAELLWQILADSPRIPAVGAPFWPLAVVWPLAVLGAVTAVRRREAPMVSAAVALVASLVLGLVTDLYGPLATALVNPWYGARERIAPLMMCLLVVLMARGLAALLDGHPRLPRLAAPAAVALLGVTVVAGLAVPGRLPLLGSLAYTAYGVQLAPYVTPQERAFIERTAQELPADAVVLADPRDGATLYWSLGGVGTVYPTMASPITVDQRLIGRYVTDLDDRRLVCGALARERPTHLYRDTSQDAGWRLDAEASAPWEGVRGVPDHQLTLVDRDGPYALYEFTPPC